MDLTIEEVMKNFEYNHQFFKDGELERLRSVVKAIPEKDALFLIAVVVKSQLRCISENLQNSVDGLLADIDDEVEDLQEVADAV